MQVRRKHAHLVKEYLAHTAHEAVHLLAASRQLQVCVSPVLQTPQLPSSSLSLLPERRLCTCLPDVIVHLELCLSSMLAGLATCSCGTATRAFIMQVGQLRGRHYLHTNQAELSNEVCSAHRCTVTVMRTSSGGAMAQCVSGRGSHSYTPPALMLLYLTAIANEG